MLISTQAIDDVTALLLPSDYYRPAHETIHDAIVDLHSRGDPVDMVTVAAELARRPADRGRTQLDIVGGVDYLHTLAAEVPIAANAPAYAATVLEKAKLRGIVEAGTKLTQLGHAGNLEAAQVYIGDAVDFIEETAMRFGATQPTAASTGLTDLTWLLSGARPESPPPRWTQRTGGGALFYAGRVNGIFGDPDAAKTWIAMTAGLEAIAAGGRFVFVDVDHNGQDHTAARLMLLGGRIEHLADPARFRYYEPEDGDQLRAAINEITTLVDHNDVVVLDSLGEILPMLGVKSVDNDEVTAALRAVAKPPTRSGACVITIDHLPKSVEARATGYAIGGTAKKRVLDGAYLRADAKSKPQPGGIGRIMLRIEKDRTGELKRLCGGGYAGTFTLDSTQPHVTTWHIGTDTVVTEDGTTRFRPTHLMEAVSRFVEDNDQCTFRAIKDATTGQDKHLRTAIQRLVEEGFMTVMQGRQRAQLHHAVAQYREAEDDQLQQPE